MQKILYVGYVWPEPNSSAAGGRTMAFLRLFRQQAWQVVYASAAALSEHRFDLGTIGVREQQIALNCDSFDAFVAAYQPDMVVFDRFFTEEQFGWRVEKHCPDAMRVLDTCDLHSLRDARWRLLKQAQHPSQHLSFPVLTEMASLADAMRGDDLALREVAAIFRCDLSLMISPFEIDLLVRYFAVPEELICLSRLMLMPTMSNGSVDFAQRRHFVSIGNFRHAPNWDAVLILKQQVWPRLREGLRSHVVAQQLDHEVQLHIYGAYPPPKAMALHNEKEGFLMRGWASDAQLSLAQSRVCLAPLRFGAGLKGKLSDAMAAGTPSVTTDIGAEGMAGDLPWAGRIENELDAFVQAALDLYVNQAQFLEAQAQGYAILQTHYQEPQLAADLLRQLCASRKQQAMRRSRNFTGAMLRHHSHKSSHYMSQWISLKNQLTASGEVNTNC